MEILHAKIIYVYNSERTILNQQKLLLINIF